MTKQERDWELYLLRLELQAFQRAVADCLERIAKLQDEEE